MIRALLTALMATAAFGAAQAGESPCAACHPAEARSQPGTSMAQALQRAADSAILKSHPWLQTVRDGYTYSLALEGDGVRYTVAGHGGTFSTLVTWAFGLGSAGQTYLYRNDGAWYESRVSYYAATGGLDVTIGHRQLPAGNAAEAAGRRLQKSEAARCFGCHAGGTPEEITPGVRCERCHENADRHALAFADRKLAPVIPGKLRQVDAEQMADLCGACHRTWQEIAANGPHDINNVRLQPYRLVSSKCYEASLSDRRLSCAACHDPHREVERSAAFYDEKCKSCHGQGQPPVRACSKAQSNCVTCHMPKIELPEAHFRFTDHRIRIAIAGGPYPD